MLSRISITIYTGKRSAGIFVIDPCQSALPLVKFVNFVLYAAKMGTGRWQLPQSHK